MENSFLVSDTVITPCNCFKCFKKNSLVFLIKRLMYENSKKVIKDKVIKLCN